MSQQAEALKEKPVQSENKMGVMPIPKLVITMSLPMMVSMLVQALYNIVDSLFVARVNSYAFTALSLAFPLQSLMIAVGVGTAVGVTANISRSLGEKKFTHANNFAKNGLFLAVMSFLAFVIIGIFVTRPYFKLQTDTAKTIEYGVQYLSIITIGSIGSFMQIMNERLLQSTGKTVLSMFSQALGALINLILDPILIFGLGFFPRLEVTGAAVATIIGQTCAACFGFFLNIKFNKELNLNLKGFRPKKAYILNIYKIGIPSIIMQSITSIMTYILNIILSSFGDLTDTLQSILGAYFKLQSFIFMPVFGLNNGTVPIISYNFGAAKRKRVIQAIKVTTLFATVIMLLGLAIMQLLPGAMLSLFDADAQMLEYGEPALRIISLSFIFAGVGIAFTSVFQSLGKPLNSMIISILRQLVIIVPTAYLLSKTGNPTMVWWSFPIAEVFSLILCCFMMAKTYKTIIAKI